VVDDDDGIPGAGGQVAEHSVVGRTCLTSEGREIVVDVNLGDGPALASGQLAAQSLLPLDAKALAAAIPANATIHRCSFGLPLGVHGW
jgi:hypothetical protein